MLDKILKYTIMLPLTVLKVKRKVDLVYSCYLDNYIQYEYKYFNLWKQNKTSEQIKEYFYNMPRVVDSKLRFAQLNILKILNELNNFCDQNNIHYFIMGGTLLGAYRHKGFIPWDDDADVGMIECDFNKLEETIKLSKTLYLKSKLLFDKKVGVHKQYRVHMRGLSELYFVDVFKYIYLDNKDNTSFNKYSKIYKKFKNEANKLEYSCYKNAKYEKLKAKYFEQLKLTVARNNKRGAIVWDLDNYQPNDFDNMGDYFKTSKIFPLKEIKFEGCILKCPNDSYEFLKIVYDNIYSIPKSLSSGRHIRWEDIRI